MPGSRRIAAAYPVIYPTVTNTPRNAALTRFDRSGRPKHWLPVLPAWLNPKLGDEEADHLGQRHHPSWEVHLAKSQRRIPRSGTEGAQPAGEVQVWFHNRTHARRVPMVGEDFAAIAV